MRNLKAVLSEIEGKVLKAGGEASIAVKRALREHRQRQFCVSVLLTVVTLCGLAACGYTLVRTEARPAKELTALFGLGGSGGALTVLRAVWKDWSRTDLLLILIEDAPEANVMALVKKLVSRL